MNIVLIQELIRFNGLITTIKESIVNVKKAINGVIIMSSSLEEVFNSMLIGKVPSLWASKSYPSLKSLGNYISDLILRLNFFQVNNFNLLNYEKLIKMNLFFLRNGSTTVRRWFTGYRRSFLRSRS